jgi:uncharacterized protein YdaU (DUF1376 family)
MHYYQHHLGDYSKDTGHLSVTEHGAYRLLLDHYYSTEAGLPSAIDKLCRIARAFSRPERDAVARVASEFFEERNGVLIQKRVDKELAEYRRLKEKNAANGALGGRPKKNPPETHSVSSGLRLGNPKHNPNESITGAVHDPVTKSHVLLEKEPKGAAAPSLPAKVVDKVESVREAPAAKPSRNGSGKALLRTEAAETSQRTTLPKDLDTAAFRSVWTEWCQWREKLAGQGKPWSRFAADNLLRQCCDNGEAWAIAELRQALASGWQGVQWDQRRNPGDVRSQPMLPLNAQPARPNAPVPGVNRWENKG